MSDYLLVWLARRSVIKDNLRRAYKLSVMLGIMMIVHLVFYTIAIELIKFFMAPPLEPFKGFSDFPEIDTLRYALIGVVIIDLFLIRFFRKLFIKRIFKPGLSRKEIIDHLVTSSCLTYSLCEAPAICGLVLFLLAGSSLDFYLFLVLSLVFLGIYFPRYSEWEGLIKKVDERVPETY